MKKTIAAIAITLALAGSAFAQEPTYEQTQKWVVDKISTNAGSNDVVSTTYEQVSMDNCSLNFTAVNFWSKNVAVHASTDDLCTSCASCQNHIGRNRIVEWYSAT